MLRRSFSVAASASASSSRTKLPATTLCQCFSTSAYSYRAIQSSGKVSPKHKGPRFNDVEKPYGRFSPRNREKGSQSPRYRSGDDFVFTGFGPAEPPTGQEVARKMRDQLLILVETGQSNSGSFGEEPCDLGKRLVAYGIKGRACEMLLYATSEDQQEVLSSHDAAFDAKALFEVWAKKFLRDLPQRARDYDARQKLGASSPTPLLQAHEQDSDRAAVGSMHDVLLSYSTEGERCLSRYIINYFLDWTEAALVDLLSPNARFRAVSGTDKAEVTSVLAQLRVIRDATDFRNIARQFIKARTICRQVHLHVGPTNSGKTHGALVALSKARTGTFLGPLRLLAHEVWDRFNSGTISPGIPPRACNLKTGEEVKTNPRVNLNSCTVEMASVDQAVDVAVVDEIQMIGDPQRGSAWTDAVLGLPAKELHLCGEASVIPLITRMVADCGDMLHIHEYKRLTPLTVANDSIGDDLTKIKAGDCMVTFSRTGIFALKRKIEQATGLRCAVAYGALPPETKAEQAKLFNEGKLDVMVASDAIGMGLNLKIKRIIFDSLTKWNGKETIALSASQIKQIAGRAGRYGTKREADEVEGGIVTTRNKNELDMLREALDVPLRPVDRAAISHSGKVLATLAAALSPPQLPTPTDDMRDISDGPEEYSKRLWKKKERVYKIQQNAAGNRQQTEQDMQKLVPRTLSEIYTDFALLSRFNPATYFMTDFGQQHGITPLAEKASGNLLTVMEREDFAKSPVNLRDELVTAFFQNAVRQYSRGALVQFNDAAKGTGMLEIEKRILQSMKSARATATATASTPQDLAADTEDRSLMSTETLQLLESLHRSMCLYLWLSFRFPLSFCYRSSVDERKKEMEMGIDYILEGIRHHRARRLRALGRTEEADEALRKSTWQQVRRPHRNSFSAPHTSLPPSELSV